MDSGPCRGAFLKYYYEPSTRSCREFTYGGCDGNANRFSSISECESICIHHEEPGNDTIILHMCKYLCVSISSVTIPSCHIDCRDCGNCHRVYCGRSIEFGVTSFVVIIQRSVKNRSTADLARPAAPNDSITMKNFKCVGRLFTPAAVAIATDSRPSSLAWALAIGVSPGYETANKFLDCVLADLALSFIRQSPPLYSLTFYVSHILLLLFWFPTTNLSLYFLYCTYIYDIRIRLYTLPSQWNFVIWDNLTGEYILWLRTMYIIIKSIEIIYNFNNCIWFYIHN